MATVIVTDSTSDIEPARTRELGIAVVPLFVIWGDRSYRDYVDLSREAFYERLAGEPTLPSTSQPTAQMFEEAFAPRVAAGDEIVCISVSSKLSGTINSARTAAARFPGARIEVVDSLTVAGGLYLQVTSAATLARAGASTDEILQALQADRQTQHLFACLADLSHLVRTGRIGKAKAVIGTLMKIVPVLTLADGMIAARAQVRTLPRAQETMIDLTIDEIADPAATRFLVMHTNAPQLAASVAARLRERLAGVEPKMLEVLEAGPVIATHGGQGAVGIFSAAG